MTAITVTPALVIAGSNAKKARGVGGATIVAGKSLYRASDGQLELADADVLASGKCVGISLNGGGVGQPIDYIEEGDLTIDGLTAGVTYAVSPTAGGIEPLADLTAGDYITILGVATSTTNLRVKILISDTVVPA